MRKKSFLLILLVAFAAFLAVALSACIVKKPEHVHDESEWKSFSAPTCTEYGSDRRDCDGMFRTALPPLGHAEAERIVTEATCSTEGYKEIYCTREDIVLWGEVIPIDPDAHSPSEDTGECELCHKYVVTSYEFEGLPAWLNGVSGALEGTSAVLHTFGGNTVVFPYENGAFVFENTKGFQTLRLSSDRFILRLDALHTPIELPVLPYYNAPSVYPSAQLANPRDIADVTGSVGLFLVYANNDYYEFGSDSELTFRAFKKDKSEIFSENGVFSFGGEEFYYLLVTNSELKQDAVTSFYFQRKPFDHIEDLVYDMENKRFEPIEMSGEYPTYYRFEVQEKWYYDITVDGSGACYKLYNGDIYNSIYATYITENSTRRFYLEPRVYYIKVYQLAEIADGFRLTVSEYNPAPGEYFSSAIELEYDSESGRYETADIGDYAERYYKFAVSERGDFDVLLLGVLNEYAYVRVYSQSGWEQYTQQAIIRGSDAARLWLTPNVYYIYAVNPPNEGGSGFKIDIAAVPPTGADIIRAIPLEYDAESGAFEPIKVKGSKAVYYRIIIDEVGQYDFILTDVSYSMLAVFGFSYANSTQITTSRSINADASYRYGLDAGVHYIEVYDYRGTGEAFTLSIVKYVPKPGEDFSTAIELKYDDEAISFETVSIVGRSNQYYRFTVERSGDYDFVVSGLKTNVTGATVLVLRSDDLSYDVGRFLGDSDGVLRLNLTAGVYYLTAWEHYDTGNAYTVTITGFFPNAGEDFSTAFEIPYNFESDSFEQAVTDGYKATYYRFMAVYGDWYNIVKTGVDGSAYVAIRVYRADNLSFPIVNSSGNSGGGGRAKLQGGTVYYIVVWDENQTGLEFCIEISRIPAGTGFFNAIEVPYDSETEGFTPVSVEKGAQLYYTFTVTEGGNYSFLFEGEGGSFLNGLLLFPRPSIESLSFYSWSYDSPFILTLTAGTYYFGTDTGSTMQGTDESAFFTLTISKTVEEATR